MYGYGMMGGIGFFFGILSLVVVICITIAPLIIWRNTNRTNRLLALHLLHQGVPADKVEEAFRSGGTKISSYRRPGSVE